MKTTDIDILSLPSTTFTNRKNLPATSGLYFVLSNDDIIYIGSTSNLNNRFRSHHKHQSFTTYALLEIAWLEMAADDSLTVLEQQAIALYSPVLNSAKSYSKPTYKFAPPRFFKLKLDKILKERNKSIYSLAKEIKTSYSTVFKMATKPIQSVDARILINICDNLKCTPNDILPIGESLTVSKNN